MSTRLNRNVVAVALAVIAAIALVGVIVLAWNAQPAPDVLVATLSGALGALAGALVPRD